MTKPRFTQDDTEGYTDAELAILNVRYQELVYLPDDALARLDDLALGSWQDHCAELVLQDFDASHPQHSGDRIKFYLIHVDEYGESHQLPGSWTAATPAEAITKELECLGIADDGRWEAHEVTSPDDVY